MKHYIAICAKHEHIVYWNCHMAKLKLSSIQIASQQHAMLCKKTPKKPKKKILEKS